MMLVPTLPAEGKLTLPNGEELDFDDTKFAKIIFGGDQLTVARVRGTQGLRLSEDKAVDRLEGLIPVIEDWHVRMSLMKVCHPCSSTPLYTGMSLGAMQCSGLWLRWDQHVVTTIITGAMLALVSAKLNMALYLWLATCSKQVWRYSNHAWVGV